jgi:hypothetical protein
MQIHLQIHEKKNGSVLLAIQLKSQAGQTEAREVTWRY